MTAGSAAATISGMALELDLRERGRGTRGILVALTVGATLLACAGTASAQTGDDGSSVDQYVEDVPTAGGSTHPGVGGSHQSTLPPSVGTQIDANGGSDAATLRDLATKSDYGGQTVTKKKQKAAAGPVTGTPGRGESISSADPEANGSAGDALSSAVSAVQGGEAARLVGLLVVVFLISVTTLTAAGLRQRRRAQ